MPTTLLKRPISDLSNAVSKGFFYSEGVFLFFKKKAENLSEQAKQPTDQIKTENMRATH